MSTPFDPADYRPRLRWPLDVQHVQEKEEHFVVLRDQREIAAEPAMIPAPLLAIVSRFDGSATIGEIAQSFAAYGVTEQFVSSIVLELDRMLFLEGERADERWSSIKEDFRRLPVRDAVLAGRVYPAEPDELEKMIRRFAAENGVSPYSRKDSTEIIGLMSPHIDYARGWHSYGAVFSALQSVESPDVVVLIGTSHWPGEAMFHLTQKAFATPFGPLEPEKDAINEINSTYGAADLFADEILHKKEHALELQLPLIALRYRNPGAPRIVPILVGSFHNYVALRREPMEDPAVSQFVLSLAGVVRKLRAAGRRVIIYCGVDLAHVGLHFGDSRKTEENDLNTLKERDDALIASLEKCDSRALFAHIAEDGDKRRICGFPSLYTALAVMAELGTKIGGHCIDYRQAVDPASDCIVTFAGLCWTEQC